MRHLLYALLATARSSLRSRRELALQNLALRQQLAILKRKTKRPKLNNADRSVWVALCGPASGLSGKNGGKPRRILSRVRTTIHSTIHECHPRRRKSAAVTPECSRTQQRCARRTGEREGDPGRGECDAVPATATNSVQLEGYAHDDLVVVAFGDGPVCPAARSASKIARNTNPASQRLGSRR